jgi:hypothetical protein
METTAGIFDRHSPADLTQVCSPQLTQKKFVPGRRLKFPADAAPTVESIRLRR